jgi:antirestriction protein ArdC
MAFMEKLNEHPKIKTSHLAAYLPMEDTIVMPDICHFQDAESYHACLFHELTHWTGAAHRLNRSITSYEADRKKYGREELIAEMGAAFLCALCHIDTSTIQNQAAYIDSWLTALRSDRRLVPEAAKAARIAVNYLDLGAIPQSSIV